jgi:hypothetical protein
MRRMSWLFVAAAVLSSARVTPVLAEEPAYEYKLLATSKTSTMEKELNEAADAGYRFEAVMGGETSFGGKEVIVIMERERDAADRRIEYKLLATNKTGTMQKELSEVAAAGFRFRGVTVGKTTFGGNEVVVITERISGGAGDAASNK